MAASVRPAGRDQLGKLTARIREIAWIPFHLDDIRSDLSVFHRIDEIDELPAPRFFAYCFRLQYYDGAVAALIRRQRARAAAAPPRREISLAQWANEHHDAIATASERMSDEGR